MNITISCLIILALVYHSRSVQSHTHNPERFLIANNSLSFATFTVLKVTSTFTSTFTSTTTCTTSTATILTCTTGRRRRGVFYDEETQVRHRRAGLFYNKDDSENEDGTVFLPVSNQSGELAVKTVNIPSEEFSVIPLEIESGFTLPEGSPNRFLISFGTSTITRVTVSYSTVSLTAICSSTTGFSLCGGARK